MKKEKDPILKEEKINQKEEESSKDNNKCNDKCCPFHGKISLRGRSFCGYVTRKFPKRIAIEFERSVYIPKYERYAKRKTRIHARLPDCMWNEINIGDYVEVKETRPISKMINFVVIRKISSSNINKVKVNMEENKK